MPGPLFATAIAEGKKNKYAGFLLAGGHAIFEVPFIIVLFIFGKISINDEMKALIGIVGGIFLLYLSFSAFRKEEKAKPLKGVIAGIALSSLNPYFIMWWLTVGFSLILKANAFGVIGLFAFIFFHEMCDVTWYASVSFLSEKSTKIEAMEKILKLVSAFLLLVFGLYFIYDGLFNLYNKFYNNIFIYCNISHTCFLQWMILILGERQLLLG